MMATADRTNIMYQPKLRPYETWEVAQRMWDGYICTLVTNIVVHFRHTKKGLFIPQKMYSSVWVSQKPSLEYVDEVVLSARQATLNKINEGKCLDEKLIAGQWQNVERAYNQWLYYDSANSKMIGKLNHV